MGPKCVGGVVSLTVWIAPYALGTAVASVQLEGSRLVVQPRVEAASVSVTVTGPAGYARSQVFAGGEARTLDLAEPAAQPADGLYVYEVRLGPIPGRGEDEPTPAGRQRRVVSGVFTVLKGHAAMPVPQPEPHDARPSPEAQVIVGDVSVQGSLCAGSPCTAGEPFGSANLLLKEQNNRVRIDDTSTAAGVPNTDWQLTFNDSAANGAGKFALQDLTNGTTPFTLLAGAPDNTLFADGSGRLGVGTAAPAALIHAVNGNTPTLRLEQDGSGVGPPYAWEVFGNHGNFVVANVTTGRDPFLIESNAPHNALRVQANGNLRVGLGIGPAVAALHVKRDDATAKLLVEENNAAMIGRNLLQLKNNGPVTLRFDNASNGTSWGFGSIVAGNKFFMSASGAPGLSMTLDPAGNLTIAGALTQSSDRNAKAEIAAVDPGDVLAKLSELPIATWRYKGDTATHLGPMAQDVHAAFGLGPDDKHVAPADLAGLGLAAIQALQAELHEQAAELRRLRARLAALEAGTPQGE